MSSRERRLILSPQALDDLTDILQYTLATWGEEQMQSYETVLDNSLNLILENPLAGFQRPAVSEQHRFIVSGQHRCWDDGFRPVDSSLFPAARASW